MRNEMHGDVSGQVIQARDIHIHHTERIFVCPRQLVAPPRFFTGRQPQLTSLGGTNGTSMPVSSIGGPGGIGKTALALHWAHRNIDRFPDGQLFVNLRGFDPSNEPVPPVVAMRGFLDALGVGPTVIPGDLDTQAALYRSLVAGRRILVFLDNARSSEQVRPLLPGSPTCTVLVTSRYQLADLTTDHGANPVNLDVLSDGEARDLFRSHVGADRVAAEPEAVGKLLHWCAGLPIAINIVAARAVRYPTFPLAVLTEELRDESDSQDSRLHTVFSWSYHTLEPAEAEAFLLVGLMPGPDISLPAATVLIGRPQVRRTLEELVTASLIQQPVPGRYRMHDLIRQYALAHPEHAEAQGDAAMRRVIDFYLHTARAGDRHVYPHRKPIPVPAPTGEPGVLHDHAAAMAWFDTEHQCLRAAQDTAVARGWHGTVWHLAWALTSFRLLRAHIDDDEAAWRAGLAAANRLQEPEAQATSHRCLGHACARTGRTAEALEHLQQALAVAERAGDRYNQAHTRWILAWLAKELGDTEQALDHATTALRQMETFDVPAWRADALSAVGWYASHLGRYDEARERCETAVALHRGQGNRNGEADTLDTLGFIALHTGRDAAAIDYYSQALSLRRELGNTYETANTLDRMGSLYVAIGRQDQAVTAWQEALRMFRMQHRIGDGDRVLAELARLEK